MIKTGNKLSIINEKYDYETGQAYAKGPSRRIARTNEKLKRPERKPDTLKKRKRDSKNGEWRIGDAFRNDVHTINSLSVGDNGDKLRLILDLRHINQFLRVPKIKFVEDIRTIRGLYQQGDYFFKFDIKSAGYHHMDILSEHQKYLGLK